MATKLRGQEVFLRRLRQFSARYGPFPDVREARAVRRFIEEVEDIVLILDRNLWVLDANRAATRFSGIDLNELRGLSARDLMTAESFELVHRNLPELFEQGVLSEAEADEIEANIVKELDEAVEFARQSPLPEPERALEDLWA